MNVIKNLRPQQYKLLPSHPRSLFLKIEKALEWTISLLTVWQQKLECLSLEDFIAYPNIGEESWNLSIQGQSY